MPFDPADAGFLADPYPAFAVLRALGPVHDHPALGTPVAVSHAACSAVLRGRELGRYLLGLVTAQARRSRNVELLSRFGSRSDGVRSAPGQAAAELADERARSA